MPYHGSQIANKWLKTNVLKQEPSIAKHIPATIRYTTQNFRDALHRYPMVVLKPVVGTGGSGLMRIERKSGEYQLRYGTRTQRFQHLESLLHCVRKYKGKRSYLIQQGIDLATYNGRPIDYRVKLVKENDQWRVKAMVGRLARRGLFVTNLCRGGAQLTSAQAIRLSLSPDQVRTKKRHMRSLSYRCKNVFLKSFPNVKQLGFDYGIDKSGNIWLLELNTRPH